MQNCEIENHVVLEVKIVNETKKALLIRHKNEQVWIAKSKIAVERHARYAKVVIPEWLFKQLAWQAVDGKVVLLVESRD